MQSCSKLILACTWQGKTIPCASLFSVRRTDDGYCCSFNTLRMSEQLLVLSSLKCKMVLNLMKMIFMTFSLNQNELESGIEDDYDDYYYDECDYENSGESCQSTTMSTTTTQTATSNSNGCPAPNWFGDE